MHMFYARSLDIPVIWLLLYQHQRRHTYNHVSSDLKVVLEISYDTKGTPNRLLYQHQQRHTYNHPLSGFKAVLEISYDTKGDPTGCCTNTSNDIRTKR